MLDDELACDFSDIIDDKVATLMIICELYPHLTLEEAFKNLDDVDFLEETLKVLEKEV